MAAKLPVVRLDKCWWDIQVPCLLFLLNLCPVCILLLAAATPLVCTNGAEVRNVGNVRLANVTIKGAVNCSMAAGQLLPPGASLNCTVRRLQCSTGRVT